MSSDSMGKVLATSFAVLDTPGQRESLERGPYLTTLKPSALSMITDSAMGYAPRPPFASSVRPSTLSGSLGLPLTEEEELRFDDLVVSKALGFIKLEELLDLQHLSARRVKAVANSYAANVTREEILNRMKELLECLRPSGTRT